MSEQRWRVATTPPAIRPFNTRKRKCEDDDNAVCLAQRLDKNSKTAPVNAAGSRLGPSWPAF
jgi:hypothetical protein